MANIRLAAATRNGMLDDLIARLDAGGGPGTLKIYSGTQPANGDAALAGNTLLGTLTFATPAAAAAASGVVTFDVIEEDVAADASETATWARIEAADGENIFDGDVGTADALIIMNTVTIVEGGPIRINSFTLTLPASMTFTP